MFGFISEVIKVPFKVVHTGASVFVNGMDALCGEDTDLYGDIDNIWKS